MPKQLPLACRTFSNKKFFFVILALTVFSTMTLEFMRVAWITNNCSNKMCLHYWRNTLYIHTSHLQNASLQIAVALVGSLNSISQQIIDNLIDVVDCTVPSNDLHAASQTIYTFKRWSSYTNYASKLNSALFNQKPKPQIEFT